MKMLQISILDAIEEASISSREDSLVNPTQAQENAEEKKTSAIYGQKCLEQFEKLNPNGLWAKTFAALLIGMEGWYSTRCNLTWKLKGTKSSRFYFQLQASTHRTEEIESGLLLTPTAVMTDESPEKMRARAEKNGYKNGTKYGSLLSQVKYGMLPTPESIEEEKTNGKNSQLNPLFVEEMMGFPENWTALPFLSGETNPSRPTETQ